MNKECVSQKDSVRRDEAPDVSELKAKWIMQRKGLGDDVCEVKKMGNGTWDQCLECYPQPYGRRCYVCEFCSDVHILLYLFKIRDTIKNYIITVRGVPQLPINYSQ